MIRPFPSAWALPACAVVATLALGCAYVPPGMMPTSTQGSDPHADSPFALASLVVVPPSGVHPSLWRVVNGDVGVQMATFQEALVRSVRESGLFASVAAGTPAQYELHAEFLRQDKEADRVVLVIRYVLSDTLASRKILDQNIETSSTTSGDPTIGASLTGENSASSRAAFRAAGKNIELLLARLRTLESR